MYAVSDEDYTCSHGNTCVVHHHIKTSTYKMAMLKKACFFMYFHENIMYQILLENNHHDRFGNDHDVVNTIQPIWQLNIVIYYVLS